ncbi:transcription factor Spi-C [Takifugu flavidus]|uniref:transcription factor Spi-C n=1 Tax=Takifugu flavidus TaxID=433684 RepID=UPI00254466C9|nr:transcription factor Spi-C [Takifugu flavidus]
MDFQETQSDLEVILEFLEEYYKQNTLNTLSPVTVDKENWTLEEDSCRQCWTCSAPPALLAHDSPAAGSQSKSAVPCERGSRPNISTRQATKHPTTAAGSGRKVRLFHFLFEMLEDPNMSHCVSWVPSATGVFRFSSTNKDQVAALWGQRKGNKRPMTYQKMSRALRNYARSGEIFKVKKKLTYQFSQDTLVLLQKRQRGDS